MYLKLSNKWNRESGRGQFDVFVPEFKTFVLSIKNYLFVGDNVQMYVKQDTGTDSYVYNDDNKGDIALDINVSGSGGAYSISYQLDGDPTELYSTSFTSTDEIVLEAFSEQRVNASDLVGCDVTINNSSDLPFNVYLTGDDTSDPRWNLVSTTGVVNVFGYIYIPPEYVEFVDYTIRTTTASESYTIKGGYSATVANPLYVDFGDGSRTKLESTLNSDVSHTYDVAGDYDVKYYGDIASFVPRWTSDTNLISLNSSIKVDYLASTETGAGANLLQDLFRNASNLESLPAYLTDKDVGATLGFSMCLGCSSLTTFPSTFLDRCPDLQNVGGMFVSAGLTAYPTGWTDNLPNLNDFQYCFRWCSGMTNAADDIWNDFPTATSTGCFQGATNLSNYASIPTGWK